MAGYPNYPSAAPVPEPPGRAEVPKTVTNAVRLMWVGAGWSLVGLIIGLVTMGNMKDAAKAAAPQLTDDQLNAAVSIGVGIAVVGGLIGVGLWAWMAWKNQAGRNWARILGTVFFGIATLSVLIGFTQSTRTTISTISSIITWLIGLGATIFMWSKDSARHYQPQQQYQAPPQQYPPQYPPQQYPPQ